MSYWDTSCLIKLYTPELDSIAFVNHLLGQPNCITSKLAILEFWATVRRKEAEGTLMPGAAAQVQVQFEADVGAGKIQLVGRDAAVYREYFQMVEFCLAQSPPVFIRTNDALHLAAAKCSGETEVVATDKRLRLAANLMGFHTFPLAN